MAREKENYQIIRETLPRRAGLGVIKGTV
jgi:hypothetical protein